MFGIQGSLIVGDRESGENYNNEWIAIGYILHYTGKQGGKFWLPFINCRIMIMKYEIWRIDGKKL